eukprot:3709535-Ditylum_brightwellii.AAC.1
MLLTEPMIVPQVGNEVDDSSSYTIDGGMLADSEFEVKEKASNQGKKQKTGFKKRIEGRTNKFAKLTNMTSFTANPYEGHELCFDVKECGWNSESFLLLWKVTIWEIH